MFLKRFNGFPSKFQSLLLGTARGGGAARIRKLSKHPGDRCHSPYREREEQDSVVLTSQKRSLGKPLPLITTFICDFKSTLVCGILGVAGGLNALPYCGVTRSHMTVPAGENRVL